MAKTNGVHLFIRYDSNGRGFRAAVAIKEHDGKYYGFDLGYAGGGCQQEDYFRISKDLKTVQLGWEDYLYYDNNAGGDVRIKLSDEENKIMMDCHDAISEFFNPDDEEWTTLNPAKEDAMDKYDNEVLVYESEGFLWDVLVALSDNWALLTSFSPN